MTEAPKDRIDRWLADLSLTLDNTEELVARGKEAFDQDPALPLAFEALCNRVGDLAKRIPAADPVRFSDSIWRQAARNRDFVVHHYDRLDKDALWVTVTVSFPELRRRLD
ncbi:HepT-like ribonuclease domain-containing protein [Arthrobacter pigmenti]